MPLPAQWATPEDFATLFQYLWHQNFPVDVRGVGAGRTDWTIHIGVVVRRIADLTGLYARFEPGRKDAVLRSTEGDEIVIEWEWGGIWGNELKKLKEHAPFKRDPKSSDSLLKYAVLITYAEPSRLKDAYEHARGKWEGARWPLLLILIEWEESKKLHTGRRFKKMQMSTFDRSGWKILRVVPAFPCDIESSRWQVEAF